MRMPVAVPRADADDRHAGAGRREEGRVVGRGPVVRHDEHLRRERTWCVPQQLRLSTALDVTGEQDSGPVSTHPQHDGRLVQLAPCAEERSARRWGEDLEGEVTERDGRPRDRDHDRDPASGRRLAHAHRLVAVGPDGRHPDRSDLHALDHGRDATGMVEVGMGHDDEVEPMPSFPDEPVGGPTVLPRIDEDPDPCALEEEGVPLADIDDRQRERHVRRRRTETQQAPWGAPREEQDQQGDEGQDDGHPLSMDAAAPARASATDACGEPRRSDGRASRRPPRGA